MTAFTTPAAAIISRLQANWVTLPIVLGNDDGKDQTLTAGFVHCEINFNQSLQATISGTNPLFRTTGQIVIHINTPINEGIGAGLGYADTIAVIFRNQTFSEVICRGPVIHSAEQIKYAIGEFWRTPLICSFQYDEHFSIV